jgi:hypothetical protein
MPFIVQLTSLLAAATEANQDKLLGYPLAGVHVGGGRHVDMPATWDGTGAVPPGWTSYKGSSRQHPTLAQWATPIDPDAPAAMANGRRARLNASEQAKMTADLAAAVASLPSDWLPAGAQAAQELANR